MDTYNKTEEQGSDSLQSDDVPHNDQHYTSETEPVPVEEEKFVPVIISDSLNIIMVEMNDKFGRISKNLEKQLQDLRQQLQAEQEDNQRLRSELALSQQQSKYFSNECNSRTNDLAEINSFYDQKKEQNVFAQLLDSVIDRHQYFVQSLQSTNYSIYLYFHQRNVFIHKYLTNNAKIMKNY